MVLSTSGAAAASVTWRTYGYNDQRTAYNSGETVVGVRNASQLHMLWSDNLGAVMISEPLEAAAVDINGVRTNVVYEGTEHGDVYALRASDGLVIWQKNLGSELTQCTDMPDEVFGVGGAGVVLIDPITGSGAILVAGGDGAVHRLDLATGAEKLGWPVTGVFAPSEESVYGGLTIYNGEVYVTVASHCDYPPYAGGVVEINLARHMITNRFYPTGPPSGGISGGGIWGPGGVSIDPSDGDVFTATGNAVNAIDDYMYGDAVAELSPSLSVLGFDQPTFEASDADFGATPTVFKPAGCPVTLIAAMNKEGGLFVYDAGAVSSGPRQMLQMANVNGWQFTGAPAWDPVTQMLYVSSSSDSSSGTYLHGLVALKARSSCTMSLAWQQSVGPDYTNVSSPSVANGVVYYGDGTGNQELAFNADTGAQLWNSGNTITGSVYASPMIANGELVVASWDDHLYAFGPATTATSG